ncbi:DUF3795 domain-containing protein [Eubacterium limosum]|uniref:DUF3795 domain-containing protein n=1 Tax=Eubacterium limosum TaxID=1736 RepID=A0ABT5UTY7_EUBLI|nr:DUF3795 domain-containing protein [Eubacterium limosum]MCB6570734.1 DUF3795 domain-containing protein [Eubacterium limosum]MDE1471804.1 DUF3795 domain-containing protein [Eubacterium limosum]
MKEIISCCGVVCTSCEYYPETCSGCPAIEGKAFWLEYTGGDICGIYECCILERKKPHCGKCGELPCHRYFDTPDPTKTPEENKTDFRRQMEQLKRMG